jgi:hypothetical protein
MRIGVLVLTACCAAVVPLLRLTDKMVLLVTLTFVRWTVALTAWVVITNASWVFSRVVGLAVVLNGM